MMVNFDGQNLIFIQQHRAPHLRLLTGAKRGRVLASEQLVILLVNF
jgi:hypothetical protein